MTEKTAPEIKQRIFDTAVKLFARKSYGLVGVREIATAAGVSISMISYHFGGKVGILNAIIKEHFDRFKTMMEATVSDDDGFEVNVRRFIRRYISIIRNNRDLMMVWNSELNNEIPEVNELKNEQLSRIKSMVNQLLHQIGMDFDRDMKLLNIIGPAIIQMIYSHFVLGVLFNDDDHETYDDQFYDRYAEMISEIVLNGMSGLVAKL